MPMKITEALVAEHVVFHSLFDELEALLRKRKTRGEIQALADLLEALLKAHSRVEDALILEPLEHCLEQLGQAEAVRLEHQELEDGLSRVRRSRSLGDARRQLLAAVARSRNHFDQEERVLFPLAERLLKGRSLTALGESWARQRQAAGV